MCNYVENRIVIRHVLQAVIGYKQANKNENEMQMASTAALQKQIRADYNEIIGLLNTKFDTIPADSDI